MTEPEPTTPEGTTLVTPRMLEVQGEWTEPVSCLPIEASDIRRWAIAVYWPEPPPPLYWDKDYAQTTRWGEIIAPRDFNPFAWPIVRPETLDFWLIDSILPQRARGSSEGQSEVTVGNRGMNGGQMDEHGVVMRPGDVITQRSRLLDWKERHTSLGHTIFTRTEHLWENQDGAMVKRRINTLIRY